MTTALSRNFANAEATAQRLRAPSRSAPKNPMLMAGGDSGNYSHMHNPEIAAAAEQYRYFRGRPYAAIQVKANRITRQRVRVARIVEGEANPKRSLKRYIQKGRILKQSLPPQFSDQVPENLELIQDHRINQLINAPNDYMVRSTMYMSTIASLEVTGRGFWILLDDAILPLPTTWMTPVHDPTPFAAWIIKPPGFQGETPPPFPAERVAHFYYEDPSDPYKCLSPLQAVARSVLADEQIAIAQHASFQNAGYPGVALMVGESTGPDGVKKPTELTPEQRRALMSWFRQQYMGVMKTGMPLILDAIVKDVKQLSNKPAEMGWTESGNFCKEQIFMGFGVPPVSAGQIEAVSRTAAAVADEHLVDNALNPLIDMMSQVMTKWLGPVYAEDGETLFIWIEPAVAKDEKSLVDKWRIAQRAYAVTRNNIRVHLLGLNPIEGWDDVVVAERMRPAPGGDEVRRSFKELLLACLTEGDEPIPANRVVQRLMHAPTNGKH